MTTTILLIRHGQTDWNAEGRWQGHVDVPLNEVGRQQAQLLAARLQVWPINAVYSSDLRRAWETATIVARALNLEPIADAQWRERDTGHYSGLTRAEVQAQFPEEWAQFAKGILDVPGAELTTALQRRVDAAFRALLQKHPDQTIAVVSHGGTLRALIAAVLDIPLSKTMRVRVGRNTGLSIITARKGSDPVLERLNDIAHLEFSGESQAF